MWGFSVENEPKQKNDEPCIGQEAEGWIFLYVLMFGQGHFTHSTSGRSWKYAGMEVFFGFLAWGKKDFLYEESMIYGKHTVKGKTEKIFMWISWTHNYFWLFQNLLREETLRTILESQNQKF